MASAATALEMRAPRICTPSEAQARQRVQSEPLRYKATLFRAARSRPLLRPRGAALLRGPAGSGRAGTGRVAVASRSEVDGFSLGRLSLRVLCISLGLSVYLSFSVFVYLYLYLYRSV